uniref:fructose-bisphosphatase n=1 Tax=viral metagenome TaxID=1070528 RepID=A0A6C0LXQ0_9ZZZZ
MSNLETILEILKSSCIKIANLIRDSNSLELSKLSKEYNISGDNVKRLDILANTILKNDLSKSKLVRAIGSEEEEDIFYTENTTAPYLVCYDPLDGSSNIGVNITTGTIFAIYQYNDNVIKDGHNIVMAGYSLYGGCCQLIVAKKNIEIFQLSRDSSGKDFFNSISKSWKIPNKGCYYAINESNKYIWLDNRNKIIGDILIKEGYSARWVASMVADAHRTLIKGGLFSYPANSKNIYGKIRLLYEAYPFAYIFKIAGGKSLNGRNNMDILDIPYPIKCHQKTPVILSSNYEMNKFLEI